MWTVVDKDQYYNFLTKNNLDNYTDELLLFELEDKCILPRYFYYNYNSDLLRRENIINGERYKYRHE